MNKSDIIDQIRIEREKAGKGNLKTIAGAIDRLQKTFPRYGSFIMEFLQNSDDAKSENIKIVIESKNIKIFNDGNVFTKADVESICDIAGSKKSPEAFIGYLGIGFKSVFLISDCPQIFSDGFNFKFDKSLYDNPKETPWQILPHFIDNGHNVIDDFKTVFDFDVKEKELISKIKEEIKPEHLNERILLFSRHLKKIHIIDKDGYYERIIIKEPADESNNDYEVHTLKHFINDELINTTNWVLFKKTFEVPDDVRNDFITIEWERHLIKKRELVCAFRLDTDKKIIREEKGTAHIGVFSFLPLKEIESGLKFLIQADFLTTPGRGEIARDCKWNEWLSKSCFELIESKCITTFKNHELWKFNYSDILTNNSGGHELFKNNITNPLKDYFSENLLLVAEDGSAESPENMIEIKQPIRQLFSDKDIIELFPNKKVIHPDCKFPDNEKLEKISDDLEKFLENEFFIKLSFNKSKTKNVQWFINLYKLIIDVYSDDSFKKEFHYNVQHDYFWNRLRKLSTPIILTQDFSLGKINEVFTNTNNLPIPKNLKNKPLIIHPDISNNETLNKIRFKLNEDRRNTPKPEDALIIDLTEEELKNRIHLEELENLNPEKWEVYSEKEKIKKTQYLKTLFIQKLIKLEDFKDKITIKSKTNNWCKPSELVLSSDYKPKHNFEQIVINKLYDGAIEFVNNKYIVNKDDYKEIEEWKKFFMELGIDKLLDKEDDEIREIVERVAILSVLKYENDKNRNPKEREASASKVGWDIDSSNRKIEVKGTSKPSQYDLFLSPNEQKALFKNVDYYVYIVTNTLNNPRIYVINGKKLSEIKDDIKLTFPYKIWSENLEIKEDEINMLD